MKRALPLFAWLVAMSAAAPARADAVEDAAKARYTEGVRLYNRKKYEEARAAFLQAIALKKRPAALMMLAESALKSGRWLEAMRSYEEYERLADPVPPKLRERVDRGKSEARSHLGRLAFDVPDGAEVTLDDRKLDDTKPIEVAVGRHVVVVAHRGEKQTVEVEALAGKTVDVRPSFVPKAIIPTETRPTTKPPPSAAPVPESPGLLSPPETKWPLYILGAVGVGGLGTAAVFGGLAANARHGVDVSRTAIARNAAPGADCARPSSFDDEAKGQTIEEFQSTCDTLARQQRFANAHEAVFQTSLIVGIAGFAGAITYFLVAPKEGARRDEAPAKESTLVIPWAGPGGGGVSVEGRF